MKSYTHIRRALSGKLWFMHEPKLSEMLAFLGMKFAGGEASAETLAEIRDAIRARGNRELQFLAINAMEDEDYGEPRTPQSRIKNVAGSKTGSVALIPVYGMIMHRGGSMSDISGPGATSIEGLRADLRQVVNDPNVRAIVLDFDSPGGDVDGVDELAAEIYDARKQKKITAVSNCLCASAAYYLASQCSEVVVSPSSMTGSIGVYTVHEDDTAYLDKLGIKFTLIKYGENKAEGVSFEPLSDAAQAHLQDMINTFGVAFEKAVGRGRKMSADDVHKKFGQGRVFDAKAAVRLGMADRVGTLDDVLGGFGVSRGPVAAASASVPAISAAGKKSDVGDPDEDQNDQADDMPSDCACACEACKGGDCKACSCKDCSCAGCACDMAAKARKGKAAMARRRIELDLAAAI